MIQVSAKLPPRVVVRGGHYYQPRPTYFEDETAQQRLFDETLGKESLRRLDPLCQGALYAVEMARRECGFGAGEKTQLAAYGVCVATAFGAQSTRVRYAKRLAQLGASATNPIDFPDSIDGAVASHIAMRFGLRGPSLTFVQGPSSAEAALIASCRLIASGRAERIYLVIGDIYDPWLRRSVADSLRVTQGSHAVPEDAVLALALEAHATSACDEGQVFVTGFTGHERHRATVEADGLVRAVTPPSQASADFSGVMQIAGAWLEVCAPMGNPEGSCQDGPMNAVHDNTGYESQLLLAFRRKVTH